MPLKCWPLPHYERPSLPPGKTWAYETAGRRPATRLHRNKTGRVRRRAAHRALGRNDDGLVCAYRPHTTPALLLSAGGLCSRSRDACLLRAAGLFPDLVDLVDQVEEFLSVVEVHRGLHLRSLADGGL